MQCKVWFLGKGMGLKNVFSKAHFNKKKAVRIKTLPQ